MISLLKLQETASRHCEQFKSYIRITSKFCLNRTKNPNLKNWKQFYVEFDAELCASLITSGTQQDSQLVYIYLFINRLNNI